MAESLYTTGGTVQAQEGGLYLVRPADQQLLELCRQSRFAYVLTPRQLGKSSLMIRAAEELLAEGFRAVTVDLTQIGTSTDPETWYGDVLEVVADQLELATNARTWWQQEAETGLTLRLTRFFEKVVLTEVSEPIVIFVDEIDTTLSLGFTDDFFAAIRYFYVARAQNPALRRLSFVLIGVATPADLIRDPKRTPFNIGERVDLRDFTPAEAAPLAAGLPLPPEQAQQALGWILGWTGGHPYLSQRLCSVLAADPPAEWSEAAVDQAVERTFFGERFEKDTNLQFVRDMLTKRSPPGYAADVLRTYRAIWNGRPRMADKDQNLVHTHLKLTGVVCLEGHYLVVRNPIYHRVFNGAWIENRQTNSLHIGTDSQGVAHFIEQMKQNVVEAMEIGDSNLALSGDLDKAFLSFVLEPSGYLQRYFFSADKQYRERISMNGKIKRFSKSVDFSSAKLSASLLALGLPLSLSLHVPFLVIESLENLIRDGVIQNEVDSTHIRRALLKSLDCLQSKPGCSPGLVELARNAYVRRYGDPNHPILKVIIDYGVEMDLSYKYITSQVLPNALKMVLQTHEDPLLLFKNMFTNSIRNNMAQEIFTIANSLNLYAISYKTLIYLVQDRMTQIPRPWIVSKASMPSILRYNIESMMLHYEVIYDAISRQESPSAQAHHIQSFFQYSSAAILSRYGAFLGVGPNYGLNELNRVLRLIHKHQILWDYCSLNQIESDLKRLGSSTIELQQVANKVQEHLAHAKNQTWPQMSQFKSHIELFRRFIDTFMMAG